MHASVISASEVHGEDMVGGYGRVEEDGRTQVPVQVKVVVLVFRGFLLHGQGSTHVQVDAGINAPALVRREERL